MIIRISLFFMLLISISFAQTNTTQEIDVDKNFSDGSKLYSEGNYEEAAKIYNDILSSGVKDFSIFYNLANTYYRMGEYGLSILNYEKSLLLKPNDADTIYNLEFVRSLVKDDITPIETSMFIKVLFFYYYYFSLNLLAVLVVLFFTIFIAGAILFIYLNEEISRKICFTFGIISFLLFIMIGITFLTKRSNTSGRYEAIIINDGTAIYSGDSDTYTLLLNVNAGVKVKIKDMEPREWVAIFLENGIAGWVRAGDIGLINDL